MGVFGALAFFYFSLALPPGMPGLMADDAIYILLAEYLSPYAGHELVNSSHVTTHGGFPPLYPFLLGLVGTSQSSLIPGHIFNTALALLSYIVLYIWLGLGRAPDKLYLSAAMVLALLPFNLIMHTSLMSEPLYMFTTILALVLSDKYPEHIKTLVLVIVLSSLTRTAGIALLVAFWIWVIVEKKPSPLKLIIISLGPLLIWKIAGKLFYQSQDYGFSLEEIYSGKELTGVMSYIGNQLSAYWQALHAYIDRSTNTYSTAAVFIIVFGAVPGFIRRLRKRKLDACYFPVYLAMIVIWPYPSHAARLLYPVMPLLFLYLVESLDMLNLPGKSTLKRPVAYGALVLITASMAPSSLGILERAIYTPAQLPENFKATTTWLGEKDPNIGLNNALIIQSVYQGMSSAREFVPLNSCVYTVHFEAFMLHGRRAAFPLLPRHIKDGAITEKNRCEYVYVIWASTHRAFNTGYPVKNYPLDTSLLYSQPLAEDNPVTVAELYRINSDKLLHTNQAQ